MRLLQVSSFLVQLLICTGIAVLTKPIGRVIDCDDPEARDAALAALQHINAHNNHGYKYAFNQVEDIKLSPKSHFGEVFSLELNFLETVCPVVSPTAVENCLVRQAREQAVEVDCDVKLLKLDGNFTVKAVRCKSELDSVENCPTCPPLAPLNDTQVLHTVDASLVKFNSGNNTIFYKLHEIGRAQIQLVPSNKVHVEFVVAASNCSLEDAHEDESSCVVQTDKTAHYGACHATLVKHQGVAGAEDEVTVQCTVYDSQPENTPQSVAPDVPLRPAQPKVVHGHFHHNLHHFSQGLFSSESSSAEGHLHETHAKHAVKRSLTGEPVPPSIAKFPLCPGRKIFF